MTEILLIRHAVNDWVKTGRLAGWTPGVHLNQEGQQQAAALSERLADVPLGAIYASPLERTLETAQAVVARHPRIRVQELAGVGEVRFGEWEGQKLEHLRKQKLWQTVQLYPSRAQFPGGESFQQAQSRAVDALESVVAHHPNQRVAVVSHSDVIKLILVFYMGTHLDFFQRIEISPASITLLYLGADRPTIVCINDTSHLAPRPDDESRRKPPPTSRWRLAWPKTLVP